MYFASIKEEYYFISVVQHDLKLFQVLNNMLDKYWLTELRTELN